MQFKNKALITVSMVTASVIILNMTDVKAEEIKYITKQSNINNFQNSFTVGNTLYQKVGSSYVIKGTAAKTTVTTNYYGTYSFGSYCDYGMLKYKSESASMYQYLNLSNLGVLNKTLYRTINDLGVTTQSVTQQSAYKVYKAHPQGSNVYCYQGGKVSVGSRQAVDVYLNSYTTKPDTRIYEQKYISVTK